MSSLVRHDRVPEPVHISGATDHVETGRLSAVDGQAIQLAAGLRERLIAAVMGSDEVALIAVMAGG